MSNVWLDDDWDDGTPHWNRPIQPHWRDLVTKKFVHPISQPDTIHTYLRQTRIWIDHEGIEHKIKNMDKEYIWNVLSWLHTNADRISYTYNFADPIGDPLEEPLVKKLERRYLKLSGITTGAISSTA